MKSFRPYAPTLLRVGLALVFLWFGISQLVNPESFLGYIPQWISPHSAEIIHEHPLQFMHQIQIPRAQALILTNGLIELVLGSLLLVGFKTRLVAGILGAHLLIIMLGLGYNDLAIRDFGLAIALFSVALQGSGPYSFDEGWRAR